MLKKYAADNKVGPGWQFLTGKFSDIKIVCRKLGFYDLDPKVDSDRTQHAGVVRIGNYAYDNWRWHPRLVAINLGVEI